MAVRLCTLDVVSAVNGDDWAGVSLVVKPWSTARNDALGDHVDDALELVEHN